jgi:DNA polymerase V
MNKVFGLLDCNNFYASCERVFDPSLSQTPIVVLSNNDGCVVARTNEVKEMGIPMGAPYFKYKTQLEEGGVRVFSSNYSLYGDMSRRVMNIVQKTCPQTEVYSIDEVFIRLDGYMKQEQVESFAKSIRTSIDKYVGIPVSIGLGPTKTLAKLANKLAKKTKSGVVFLDTQEKIRESMQNFPVQDVWGIGRKSAQKLSALGVQTAKELTEMKDSEVRRILHTPGMQTVQELRGVSCFKMESIRQPRKSIISSRSFGQPVEELADLEEAVALYATRATEKLRLQGSVARYVMVMVRTNPFSTLQPYYANSHLVVLPEAVDTPGQIISAAHKALREVFRSGYQYKKAGVMLLEISPNKKVQTNFLHNPDTYKTASRVAEVMEAINQKFGRHTLIPASTGLKREWGMKQENRSLKYTTDWDELLTISI